MSKSLNPEMLTLARELIGISQIELSLAVDIKQPRIAKLEIGSGADISEIEIQRIAKELRVPESFLYQPGSRIGFGSSEFFTRTRKLVSGERKRISGIVNVLRLHTKRMLDFVEISSTRTIPKCTVSDYKTASNAARAVRAQWRMPIGPVTNVTKVLEAAGIIIIECDFGSMPIDATSIVTADIPPCIFINKNVPGDRWRFTLAHELAHMVMHDLPSLEMENEADEFASEFLMPTDDISPMFAFGDKITIEKLGALKEIWGTSMSSLIMKAAKLGKLTPNQKKWLYVQMSSLGFRTNEPYPIQKETTYVFDSILSYFRDTSGLSKDDFARMLNYLPEELNELYEYSPRPNRVRLRIV